MTIDEAIKHAEDVAEENLSMVNDGLCCTNNQARECLECGKEHRQFAKWLRELKKYREPQPCEDAVSREAVHDLMATRLSDYLLDETREALEVIDVKVEDLSSVTPQPKMGRWIYDNFDWRCSECNEVPKTLGYVGTADFMSEHFKYCNHCGARMIKPQESEG